MGSCGRRAHDGRRQLNETTVIDQVREVLRVEDVIGADIKCAGSPLLRRQQVRLGDVVRVNGLDADALRKQKRGQLCFPQHSHRGRGTKEEALDLGSRVSLEDQAGAQPGDSDVRVGGFEGVKKCLDSALVLAVVRSLNASRREVLSAQRRGVLRVLHAAAGVVTVIGPDRRGDNDVLHPSGCRSVEHTLGAFDVDSAQQLAVVVGVDDPGQVDDGVGTCECAGQLGNGLIFGCCRADINAVPLHSRVGLLLR